MARLGKQFSMARSSGGLGLDLPIALGFAVVGVVQIAPQLKHSARPVLALVAVAVIAGTLLFRRRRPAFALAVALVAMVVFVRLAEVSRFTALAAAVAVLFYSLALHGSGPRLELAGGALLAALAGVIAIDPHTRGPSNGVVTVMLFGIVPLSAGLILRNRQALARELRQTTASLERSRRQREREVAVGERIRVARELHDVVAHSVSVMVIQAGAARRVAGRDRDRAREALQSVQTSGRVALGEMRYMVGALRRGENGSDDSSTPGIGHLDELVARAREAGLDVGVSVEGQAEPLSSGLDLVVYRIVQEALTNTLKHAKAGRATVLVRYTAGGLELDIRDDGRGRRDPGMGMSSGHGLIGMRERVALYGGELEVGAQDTGGFAVRARLPLTEAAG